MCTDCGCGEATAHHHQAHDNKHDHAHGHDHAHDHHHHHDGESKRTVTLESRILARNDEIATENRTWLQERGIVAINMISSPGSGKTMLLEKTLERLKGRVAAAVIAGDQQTDHDAQRLQGKGAPVVQIETVSSCHLDAERVREILPEVVKEDTRLLFIENVGNLVCPAAFDLGETFKIALLSATEGEDKPVKYPALFSQVPVAILTKMDLVPYLDWDVALCRDYLRRIRPGVFLFELSSKSGDGMDAWIDYLVSLTA